MMSSDETSLIAEPPNRNLRASVVIPARNEEELLPFALRALDRQLTCQGGLLDYSAYEVILLINNSRDRSKEVAQKIQRQTPGFRLHILERNFSSKDAHIGNARRVLMDEACRRLEIVNNENSAILSTDADSYVSSHWIAANLAELGKGADAVGGRILIPQLQQERLDPFARKLNRYYDLYYRLVSWVESQHDPECFDPWPRHHQHFGASLAVVPSAYREVGRLPRERSLEDIAFYRSLVRCDRKLRHSNRVKVFTSARLSGRADTGLSSKLSEWKSQGQRGTQALVESVPFLEYLFATRRQLREIWRGHQARERLTAARLRIPVLEFREKVYNTPQFGLLLERLNFYDACRKTWSDEERLAPLAYVVNQLLKTLRYSRQIESYALACQSDSANGHSWSTHTRAGLNPLASA